jgi:P27 family predicted phage terminase small subunit
MGIKSAPDDLTPTALAAWNAFWASPQSDAVEDVHLPALCRLFGLYSELEEVWALARKHRLVQGSNGQPVPNPLYRATDTLRAEIRALEDRFGLNPLARARLVASTKEPDSPDEFALLLGSLSATVGDDENAQPADARPGGSQSG